MANCPQIPDFADLESLIRQVYEVTHELKRLHIVEDRELYGSHYLELSEKLDSVIERQVYFENRYQYDIRNINAKLDRLDPELIINSLSELINSNFENLYDFLNEWFGIILEKFITLEDNIKTDIQDKITNIEDKIIDNHDELIVKIDNELIIKIDNIINTIEINNDIYIGWFTSITANQFEFYNTLLLNILRINVNFDFSPIFNAIEGLKAYITANIRFNISDLFNFDIDFSLLDRLNIKLDSLLNIVSDINNNLDLELELDVDFSPVLTAINELIIEIGDLNFDNDFNTIIGLLNNIIGIVNTDINIDFSPVLENINALDVSISNKLNLDISPKIDTNISLSNTINAKLDLQASVLAQLNLSITGILTAIANLQLSINGIITVIAELQLSLTGIINAQLELSLNINAVLNILAQIELSLDAILSAILNLDLNVDLTGIENTLINLENDIRNIDITIDETTGDIVLKNGQCSSDGTDYNWFNYINGSNVTTKNLAEALTYLSTQIENIHKDVCKCINPLIDIPLIEIKECHFDSDGNPVIDPETNRQSLTAKDTFEPKTAKLIDYFMGDVLQKLFEQNHIITEILCNLNLEDCFAVMPTFDVIQHSVDRKLIISFIKDDGSSYPIRKSSDSKWNLTIPDPIDNIDWCTHIDHIRKYMGNQYSRLEIEDVRSGINGWFLNEPLADEFFNKINVLTKRNETNRIYPKHKSPKANIQENVLRPERAYIITLENGEIIEKICLRPPVDGCS